ncbi:hypothetical protein K435DRAFT_846544 [Dendrothele bispora CBS 962.96]|uniref:DUF2306 domain-containing protein n=1 Tax=Dendrothele bispora (strain CBS 962.96) TaxID=1314807 RepID=A0A4S8KM56_DENBC|nr:hypothetical protein K435DRAFT_846544 [Dendrothele bispora CBS 962.96]
MALYSPRSPSSKQDDQSYTSAGNISLEPNRYRKEYSAHDHQLPTLHDGSVRSFQANPAVVQTRDSDSEKSRYGVLKPFLTVYRAFSGMLGFKEKYTLLCAFVSGGALLGFCLARAMMTDGKIRRQQSPPGDYRWFDLKLYGISYAIHVYMAIVGGILVGLQFLPVIRRKFVLFHRLNGYFCVLLLIPGNIAGAIVARRSYGGEINQQAAWYLLTIMLTFAMVMGLLNVKRNTRQHRKWMMRSVVYFSVVILSKVLSIISRSIITKIGGYYSVWRCDEVLYVLQDANALGQRFPECVQNVSDISNNPFSVAVLASNHGDKLERSSALRLVAAWSFMSWVWRYISDERIARMPKDMVPMTLYTDEIPSWDLNLQYRLEIRSLSGPKYLVSSVILGGWLIIFYGLDQVRISTFFICMQLRSLA